MNRPLCIIRQVDAGAIQIADSNEEIGLDDSTKLNTTASIAAPLYLQESSAGRVPRCHIASVSARKFVTRCQPVTGLCPTATSAALNESVT